MKSSEPTTPLLIVKAFLCSKNIELIHHMYPHVSQTSLLAYMQQYISANKGRLRNDMDPRKQLKLLNDDFLKVIKKFIELPKIPSQVKAPVQKSSVQPMPPVNFASAAPIISPRYQPPPQKPVAVQKPVVVQAPVQYHQQQVMYYDEQDYETVISDDDDEWCTKVEDIDSPPASNDTPPIVVEPQHPELPVPEPIPTQESRNEVEHPVDHQEERLEEQPKNTVESVYDDLPLLNL